MRTIALIGDTKTSSVRIYYHCIKEAIIQKDGNPDLLDCILYSCKFLESENEEDEVDVWHINSAKLSEVFMSIASSAKRLVFCDPMLHLLLNEIITEGLVIDLVESITLELQRRSVKRIVTLGIHKKLDKQYFSLLIRKGFELFSFENNYERAVNDHERISLISKLPGINMHAMLLHNRSDVEELLKRFEAPLPILFTHKVMQWGNSRFFTCPVLRLTLPITTVFLNLSSSQAPREIHPGRF